MNLTATRLNQKHNPYKKSHMIKVPLTYISGPGYGSGCLEGSVDIT